MELHTDDRIISRQSNWVFDEHVAPEFDKHVRKSVPNYVHVQDLKHSVFAASRTVQKRKFAVDSRSYGGNR